jgi:hypothetical protein
MGHFAACGFAFVRRQRRPWQIVVEREAASGRYCTIDLIDVPITPE